MKSILNIKLQKKLKYFFKNKKLLKQSLTHRSASNIHNERLEFLGDSILNYVITKFLYKNFSSVNEGGMSRMRATLVKKNTLANIAKRFNLSKYIILGAGEIKNKGSSRKSILSNTLEAIIGGIFLDSNIIKIEKCVLNWYVNELKIINSGDEEKDPKTRLQEYLQSNNLSLPIYYLYKISGKDHKQTFTIYCKLDDINNKIIGIGKSKREAEQKAAKNALKMLKLL